MDRARMSTNVLNNHSVTARSDTVENRTTASALQLRKNAWATSNVLRTRNVFNLENVFVHRLTSLMLKTETNARVRVNGIR
ncbi:unnamed protein product [Acanthoscelides obtectus]|uniref:Uncharacterized protein n=1 Tax=Acanthoscelides obtectus TaxID=200917 RepID=A0A9P0PJN3_ACAOB|nr:unnamed protein product [Acanthoscelides obtectus]CAK1620326.1 hypothetical protein AOBTE_LOCUS311 [Acanthoscelides obtectus]